MDDFADSAAAVLADAGIGVAHIVGVSFGGVVAVRLALRHPGIVRSLVLADSTPGSGVSPERAADMRRRVVELARLGPRAYAAERAPNLLSASAPADLVARVTSAMAAAIRLPGFGYVAEAMASTDHRTRFCEISAPTLVLCGEHDSVAPPTVSKAIAAAVPGARFTSIRGAGHLSNQERPDVFNRHVEAFFESC
jgi:pimeloyl-ACP methyl ester carboxylesterase